MMENVRAAAKGETEPKQNGKALAAGEPTKSDQSRAVHSQSEGDQQQREAAMTEQSQQGETSPSSPRFSHHYRADETLVSPHYFFYTKPSLTPPTFVTTKPDNVFAQQPQENSNPTSPQANSNKPNGAMDSAGHSRSHQSKEVESLPQIGASSPSPNASFMHPKPKEQSPDTLPSSNSSDCSPATNTEIPLHIQCDPSLVALQGRAGTCETAAPTVELVALRSTLGVKRCLSLAKPFAQLPSSRQVLVAHLQVEPLLGSMIPKGVRDAINIELALSPVKGQQKMEVLVKEKETEASSATGHDWKSLATDIKGKVAFFESCMVKQKAKRPTSDVVAKITKEVAGKVLSAQQMVEQSLSKTMDKENVMSLEGVMSTPISTKIERVENFFPQQQPTKAVPKRLGSNTRGGVVTHRPVKDTTTSSTYSTKDATPSTSTDAPLTTTATESPQQTDPVGEEGSEQLEEQKNGTSEVMVNGLANLDDADLASKVADVEAGAKATDTDKLDAARSPPPSPSFKETIQSEKNATTTGVFAEGVDSGAKAKADDVEAEEKNVDTTPDTSRPAIDKTVQSSAEQTSSEHTENNSERPAFSGSAKQHETKNAVAEEAADLPEVNPTTVTNSKGSREPAGPELKDDHNEADDEAYNEFPLLGNSSMHKKALSKDKLSKSYAQALAQGKKEASVKRPVEKIRALDVPTLKEIDLPTLKSMDITGFKMPVAESLVNAIVEENKNVYENAELQEQLTKAITRVPRVTKPAKSNAKRVKEQEKANMQIKVDDQPNHDELKRQKHRPINVQDDREWDTLMAEKQNDEARVNAEEEKSSQKPQKEAVKAEAAVVPKKARARKKKARGQVLMDSSETTTTSVDIAAPRHVYLEEIPERPLPAAFSVLHAINNILHRKPISYVFHGIFWFCFLVFGGPIATLGVILQTSYRLFHHVFISRYRTIVPDKSGKKLAVVITGCDSGFGRALAEALIDEGFYVFCGCFQKESLHQFEKMGRAIPVRIDVTKDKEVDLARKAVAKWLTEADRTPRCLHALVNNAGIGEIGLIDWLDMAQFQKMMDVNYYGMLRLSKRFLPILKKQAADGIYSDARIVNLVSIAGLVSGSTIGVGYEASKHAADAFSTNLRMEMKAFGVNVTSINPSFHRTPLTRDMASDLRRTWHSLSPEKKAEYGEEFLEGAVAGPILSSKFFNWDADNVVTAITKSILTKDPPARILIGSDAKYLLIFSKMLPDWFTQYLLNAPSKLPAMMRKHKH